MKSLDKKASVFVYVLILINIALILWYVVFNNTYIMNNNISIWRNSEEVYSQIYNKWNINIQAVKEFNSNWWWFEDLISCPTNITMSWTTMSWSNIFSEMRYEYGTTYCSFDYEWLEGRIFFDSETNFFSKIFFSWENIDIIQSFSWETLIDHNDFTVTSSFWNYWWDPDNVNDNDEWTHYVTDRDDYSWIEIDLDTPSYLSRIFLDKPIWPRSAYWNNWILNFYNQSNDFLESKTVSWVRNTNSVNIPLSLSFIDNSRLVDKINIYSSDPYRLFNISELYLYEYSDTSNPIWVSKDPFSFDWWTTFSFDENWVSWDDNFDDNMNSDNYRSTSTGSVWYPWDFWDDDITPRLNIYGSVEPNTVDYHNAYWNNYKTIDFINNNPYNNDNVNVLVKNWDVEEWYLFFDMFSKTDENLDYDVKILEFDRNEYKDNYTLLPKNSWETTNIKNNFWYLQEDSASGTLSLSTFKTWDEFIFNFKENDYAIFFKNNRDSIMAYKISWEEKAPSWNINDIWKSIYINPIDESEQNQIKTLSNYIIIWWEKNFIWDNFVVIWAK